MELTKNQLEEYNLLRDRTEKLQKEYDDLEEKIGETNNKFDSISKSVSDTSSLTNFRQNVQKLSSECLSMDMRVQILNHSILKYKLYFMKTNNISNGNYEGIDTSMFDEYL
jgi:predicted  nucleic acid-binding Zn-ribbon protein